MQGAKDLLGSERGVFCIAVSLIATLLVLVGKIDGTQWLDFMKYLSTALVASKALTNVVATYKRGPEQIPPATVVKE